MTGGSVDPANSNTGDRRNDILELTRTIRETDNQKAQLPKVQVSLFDGTNVSAWADKFEQLGSCCEWTSEKMLQMVKRYCQVGYKEEVSELVQSSRDWSDVKTKLLEKYQLGDQLLDLADLRKVSHRKFGTTKQFLTEFERVARLVSDLPDKDRCLIFLENFLEVEQRKLIKDMAGRYDWPKIKKNLLAGSFDQMLYRLLKQQKEDRKKEGVSADKDQTVYKILTDMRNMMADMKEERLKLQVMMVQTKGGKRKGKAPVVEEVSSSRSEEEDEEEVQPARKLTKAERKALNQIRIMKEAKNVVIKNRNRRLNERIMKEAKNVVIRNRRLKPLLSNPNPRQEAEAEVEDRAMGEVEEMGPTEAIGKIGFASIVVKMGMGYGFVRLLQKMRTIRLYIRISEARFTTSKEILSIQMWKET
ncbi:hypothetical protein CBR_g32356 [Chara braunii]|uniref:Retrotransposon gag domain-containing protein n=1 Tax=Chara braunii TaxID=69332 RepID=A0A388JY87_CHABU|nr:hypothetical protein CBR_g32356 [Chara braunii]|eukprot:GBG62766.1 hypothetical protein CBR_g32356 [Chara braunii]